MKAKPSSKGIRILSIILVLSTLLLFSGTAFAQGGATVRGRLVRRDAHGRVYPAAYIAVTLNNEKMGRSSPAYTDADGMYYLYRVPPGEYRLEIWLHQTPNPSFVYKIVVYDQSYTDISPIEIR